MKRLNQREKRVVIGGVVLLVLFSVHQFVIAPAQERLKLLERKTLEREKELQEMIYLKAEYEALKSNDSQKAKKIQDGKKVITLSYLESLANKAGLKKNIKHMKPLKEYQNGDYVQSSIEIRLSQVSMNNLVQFLYDIENSEKAAKISELNIMTNNKDPSYLDVEIQITSFRLAV